MARFSGNAVVGQGGGPTMVINQSLVGVIESIALEAPKSKAIADMLSSAGLYDKKCLVLLGQTDKNVLLSARNLPRVKTTLANQVTTYELLDSEFVLMTQEGLEKLKEVFLSERS